MENNNKSALFLNKSLKTRFAGILALVILLTFAVSCGGGGINPQNSLPDTDSLLSNESMLSNESEEPLTPGFGEQSGVSAEDAVNYLSLGDSIAYGFSLEKPGEMCYGALLAEKMGEIGKVNYVNRAVTGLRTSGLAQMLSKPEMKNLTPYADIVTVSIGANDLLTYAAGELLSLILKYGAGELFAPGNEENSESFAGEVEKALTGDSFKRKAESGLNSLKSQLPIVLRTIIGDNPEGIVFIQTIYNPFKGIELSTGSGRVFDLSSLTDEYLFPFNEAIINIAEETGAIVVDVYGKFNDSDEKLINAGLYPDRLPPFVYDPHPNTRGQEVIAELIYESYSALVK